MDLDFTAHWNCGRIQVLCMLRCFRTVWAKTIYRSGTTELQKCASLDGNLDTCRPSIPSKISLFYPKRDKCYHLINFDPNTLANSRRYSSHELQLFASSFGLLEEVSNSWGPRTNIKTLVNKLNRFLVFCCFRIES